MFFSQYPISDVTERRECNESVFLENGTTFSTDSGYEGLVPNDMECPASPTTIPVKSSRSNSANSQQQIKSPKPRRQRTTSVNQNTSCKSEPIIRSNHRTIYTAGRPPWYNCAGQQVEPFVIGILNQSLI